MNSLVSVRSNTFYHKEKKDEKEVFTKHHEVVLLIDNPKYTCSNEGEVLRERSIEQLRFTVSDDGVDQLIKYLEAIRKEQPIESPKNE